MPKLAELNKAPIVSTISMDKDVDAYAEDGVETELQSFFGEIVIGQCSITTNAHISYTANAYFEYSPRTHRIVGIELCNQDDYPATLTAYNVSDLPLTCQNVTESDLETGLTTCEVKALYGEQSAITQWLTKADAWVRSSIIDLALINRLPQLAW